MITYTQFRRQIQTYRSVHRLILTALILCVRGALPLGGQPFRTKEICADGESTRICVPEGYMKFELPTEGEPTFVSIGVDIKDIPKVSAAVLQCW